MGRGLEPGSRRVGLCFVYVSHESGLFIVDGRPTYLHIVLVGNMRILGAPRMLNHVAH